MNLPCTDMDDLRVYIYTSNENIEILDYKVGEPDWGALKRMKLWQSCDVVEAEKDVNVNNNLSVFQRIPKSPDGSLLSYGDQLFQHIVRYLNMMCNKDGKLEPSKYLGLEISSEQLQILNLAEQGLRRSNTFQDAMGKSSRKLATRKLNVIGNLTGHSSVITSDENLRRAQEDCRLASTYEEINERQKQFKDMEIVQKKNEIKLATDSGIHKLRSNGCDFDRLTKI